MKTLERKKVDKAIIQDIHEGLIGVDVMVQEIILMLKQLEELRGGWGTPPQPPGVPGFTVAKYTPLSEIDSKETHHE